MLSALTATQMLAVVREAHTGEPATTSTTPPAPAAVPAARTALTGTIAHEPSVAPPPVADQGGPTTPTRKALLRVLGPISIDDVTRPGRPLRAKAAELATLLACHPDGMGTRDIGEYLEPDAKVDESDQRVHTNVSNLRHVFGRAAGPIQKGYVIQPASRYQLDPTVMTSTSGRCADAYAKPRSPADPDAVTCSKRPATSIPRRWPPGVTTSGSSPTAKPPADGPPKHTCSWPTNSSPPTPSPPPNLLDKAIGLDRYNEELYRRAMHTRFALNDPAGVHILLQALTNVLADLDAMPTADTAALVTDLCQQLALREP